MKNILRLLFSMLSYWILAQKTHIVSTKETLYSISRKYEISVEKLIELNPKIKNSTLSIGEILYVSDPKEEKIPKKSSGGKLGKIYLQPKQTIYGITRQYKISEAELRKLNPDLDNQMKIGYTIILPEDNIRKYSEKVTTSIQKSTENKYIIQPKDTYYRITRKFSITKEQLLYLNPGLEEKGLQPGNTIIIKPEHQKTINNPSDVKNTVFWTEESPQDKKDNQTIQKQENFITYSLKNEDTIFGISSYFDVSYDQLLALNPDLKNGLKQGTVIKIKTIDSSYIRQNEETFNIVFMLPFGFNHEDDKYRTISVDFLSGARLAIEKNAEKGQKLDIKIVDAGNKRTFKNNLIQINENNTDLIIGPFFKSNILEVLKYVEEKEIPVVAPFAHSEDLYDYENLIIVESLPSIYSDLISDEVQKIYSNQKIYILSEKNSEIAQQLKEQLEAKINNLTINLVNDTSEIISEQNIITGQSIPIIAILASEDKELAIRFTNKLVDFSEQEQMTNAFSMYYHPVFDKYTHKLSKSYLVYPVDKKINTEGDFEQEIIKAYHDKYCTYPSKYAVTGFDIVNDMLMRKNQKENILKNMNKVQTHLATKFKFERSKKNGAYINTGYRIVRIVNQ